MDSNLITAVGIDVSKGKSTVAIRRPGGEIVRKPFTVKHDQPGLQQLIQLLHEVGGEIRIVMEHTGMYWRPIASVLQQEGFYLSVQVIRTEMQRLASLLPEYPVVMEMKGAGQVTGPQLMAEIGDVRRFTHKGALVAFAGVDAPPFQSGDFEAKSRHVSKRGSSTLRRTLFQICSMSLCRADPEDPIFCFMDKKRSEGKHFYVYTVAGAAKFLRIYYARVKQYLNQMETASASVSPN